MTFRFRNATLRFFLSGQARIFGTGTLERQGLNDKNNTCIGQIWLKAQDFKLSAFRAHLTQS